MFGDLAKPGQFIILRVDEDGERIPLTVAGVDKENGTVKIIYQIVGATTKKLDMKSRKREIIFATSWDLSVVQRTSTV